jgi:hypothetical protein
MGLKLLWKKNLTKTEAIRAHRFLKGFVKDTKRLYGSNYLTIKFHSLLHTTCAILDFGRLAEFSCIHAENVNGFLSRQVFGTHNFLKQLIDRFTVFTMLKTIFQCIRDASGNLLENTIIGKLLEKFGIFQKNESKYWKKGNNQYKNISFKLVNKEPISIPRFLNDKVKKILNPLTLEDCENIYNLKEIKINGKSFYIKERDTMHRSSSYITYKYKGKSRVGRIYAIWFFFEINKILLLMKYICKTKSDTLYYNVTHSTQKFHVIEVLDVLDQMVVCPIGNNVFAAEYEGLTFTVSPHPDDTKYPLDQENEELNDFIQDQVRTWLGRQ